MMMETVNVALFRGTKEQLSKAASDFSHATHCEIVFGGRAPMSSLLGSIFKRIKSNEDEHMYVIVSMQRPTRIEKLVKDVRFATPILEHGYKACTDYLSETDPMVVLADHHKFGEALSVARSDFSIMSIDLSVHYKICGAFHQRKPSAIKQMKDAFMTMIVDEDQETGHKITFR